MGSGADNINRYVITTLMNLSENGCAIGALHTQELEEFKKEKYGHKKVMGISVGHWKFYGTPAIIISVFLGIAALQYAHTLHSAERVKEEARTEAVNVAEKVVVAAKIVDEKDKMKELRAAVMEILKEERHKE